MAAKSFAPRNYANEKLPLQEKNPLNSSNQQKSNKKGHIFLRFAIVNFDKNP